jgi:hypothetical protein
MEENGGNDADAVGERHQKPLAFGRLKKIRCHNNTKSVQKDAAAADFITARVQSREPLALPVGASDGNVKRVGSMTA